MSKNTTRAPKTPDPMNTPIKMYDPTADQEFTITRGQAETAFQHIYGELVAEDAEKALRTFLLSVMEDDMYVLYFLANVCGQLKETKDGVMDANKTYDALCDVIDDRDGPGLLELVAAPLKQNTDLMDGLDVNELFYNGMVEEFKLVHPLGLRPFAYGCDRSVNDKWLDTVDKVMQAMCIFRARNGGLVPGNIEMKDIRPMWEEAVDEEEYGHGRHLLLFTVESEDYPELRYFTIENRIDDVTELAPEQLYVTRFWDRNGYPIEDTTIEGTARLGCYDINLLDAIGLARVSIHSDDFDLSKPMTFQLADRKTRDMFMDLTEFCFYDEEDDEFDDEEEDDFEDDDGDAVIPFPCCGNCGEGGGDL